MNKLKVTLFYALALFAMVSLNSCSSDEDTTPTNVIDDEDGVKIDLEWTTGGSIQDAYLDADLDILVYRDGKEVLSSENGYSFERTILESVYGDGVYTVVAYLDYADKRADYTVTVNGVTVTKPSTFKSYFVADAYDAQANTLKITKKGNTYTIDDAD